MIERDAGLSALPDGWWRLILETIIQIIDYREKVLPYSLEGILHLQSSNIKNDHIN